MRYLGDLGQLAPCQVKGEVVHSSSHPSRSGLRSSASRCWLDSQGSLTFLMEPRSLSWGSPCSENLQRGQQLLSEGEGCRGLLGGTGVVGSSLWVLTVSREAPLQVGLRKDITVLGGGPPNSILLGSASQGSQNGGWFPLRCDQREVSPQTPPHCAGRGHPAPGLGKDASLWGGAHHPPSPTSGPRAVRVTCSTATCSPEGRETVFPFDQGKASLSTQPEHEGRSQLIKKNTFSLRKPLAGAWLFQQVLKAEVQS